MRQHRLTTTPGARLIRVEGTVQPPEAIERLQLERLASAVLSKRPADLAALAENNPMLIREWIEVFRRERCAAEADARYWAAAMAALSTATPGAVLYAAE